MNSGTFISICENFHRIIITYAVNNQSQCTPYRIDNHRFYRHPKFQELTYYRTRRKNVLMRGSSLASNYRVHCNHYSNISLQKTTNYSSREFNLRYKLHTFLACVSKKWREAFAFPRMGITYSLVAACCANG